MEYAVVYVPHEEDLEEVLNEYGRGWWLHTIWFNPKPGMVGATYAKCVFEREDPS
jgi:hypothetical protein